MGPVLVTHDTSAGRSNAAAVNGKVRLQRLLFRRRISNQSIKLFSGLFGIEFASIDLLLNVCFDLDDLLFRRIAVWLFGHRSLALFDRLDGQAVAQASADWAARCVA